MIDWAWFVKAHTNAYQSENQAMRSCVEKRPEGQPILTVLQRVAKSMNTYDNVIFPFFILIHLRHCVFHFVIMGH